MPSKSGVVGTEIELLQAMVSPVYESKAKTKLFTAQMLRTLTLIPGQ